MPRDQLSPTLEKRYQEDLPPMPKPEIVRSQDHADELLAIAREVVEETVASGSSCDDPTLACTCFVCRALRILVEVEGPGRCVICGCDAEHACAPEGCSWADDSRRVCDRHPPEDVATARLVLAKEPTP